MSSFDKHFDDTYDDGFIDGLAAYAWWADGVQYVGTSGRTLKEAIEKRRTGNSYNPPSSPNS